MLGTPTEAGLQSKKGSAKIGAKPENGNHDFPQENAGLTIPAGPDRLGPTKQEPTKNGPVGSVQGRH